MTDLIKYSGNREFPVSRMVVNFTDPFADTGGIRQIVEEVTSGLDGRSIAQFNADKLYDYRSQRPVVTYGEGKILELAYPEMKLNLVKDLTGENFLYLCGPEPDFNWHALSAEIISIAKRFSVERVFTFSSLQANVPHTKPAVVLVRSTKPRSDVEYVDGPFEHFGEFADFFEYFAGAQGIEVNNIRAQVPFYMSSLRKPFIPGALAAIKMAATLDAPKMPFGDLEQLEGQFMEDLNSIVVEGLDFEAMLRSLEEQYDHLVDEPGFIAPTDNELAIPSTEEIAEAVERFLATQRLPDIPAPVVEEYIYDDVSYTELTGTDYTLPKSDRTKTEERPVRRGKHHY